MPISTHVKFEKQITSNAQINETILENPSIPVPIPKKASALTAFRSAIRKQFNSDKLAKSLEELKKDKVVKKKKKIMKEDTQLDFQKGASDDEDQMHEVSNEDAAPSEDDI